MDQQHHEMILDLTRASGAEEWLCPTCGRRMAVTWYPWKKIILEPGDIYAGHSASKGGLRITPPQITMSDDESPQSAPESPDDDPYLAPWQRWLDQADTDDLWNRDL